jgi:hypothetical protein
VRGEIARQIDCYGRLARPAFRVQDDDALHGGLVLSHPLSDAGRSQAYARRKAPASRCEGCASVSARTSAHAVLP